MIYGILHGALLWKKIPVIKIFRKLGDVLSYVAENNTENYSSYGVLTGNLLDILEELTASTSRAVKKNELLAELVAYYKLQITLYSESVG
jgi:hypothetical protein